VSGLSEAERGWLAEAEYWTQNYPDFRGMVGWRIKNLAARLAAVEAERDDALARLAEVPDLRQRLYVALVEQRVIDSRHYGEAPYAPVTWEDVDRALDAPARDESEGAK